MINAVGSMAMEARSRAADTWAAASPMMRQFLRSTTVSMKNKVTIVHVLFMTRLLYNAGTWSKLSEDDEKVLQRTLVQIVRCVTGETYQHGKSLKTAREVLAKAGLPCIEILPKQARLNMLTRVATCMSPQLHAIIQASTHQATSWASLVKQDLHEMWLAVRKVQLLPNPMEDPGPWCELVAKFPHQWKKLVTMHIQAGLKV